MMPLLSEKVVGLHYQDSWVPLGNFGLVWRDREPLDDREEQRGSEGLILVDSVKLRG